MACKCTKSLLNKICHTLQNLTQICNNINGVYFSQILMTDFQYFMEVSSMLVIWDSRIWNPDQKMLPDITTYTCLK